RRNRHPARRRYHSRYVPDGDERHRTTGRRGDRVARGRKNAGAARRRRVMRIGVPVALALIWTLPPLVALLRARRSRWLDDISPDVASPAPLVSVIVPARDELRNIELCVRSIL